MSIGKEKTVGELTTPFSDWNCLSQRKPSPLFSLSVCRLGIQLEMIELMSHQCWMLCSVVRSSATRRRLCWQKNAREKAEENIDGRVLFLLFFRSPSPLNAKRIGESRLRSVSSPFTSLSARDDDDDGTNRKKRTEQTRKRREDFLLDTMQIHVGCNLPPTIVDRTMTSDSHEKKGFQRVEQTPQ